jgi:hypothetical protein
MNRRDAETAERLNFMKKAFVVSIDHTDCPGGTDDLSPAIYRWVRIGQPAILSPGGTTENLGVCLDD